MQRDPFGTDQSFVTLTHTTLPAAHARDLHIPFGLTVDLQSEEPLHQLQHDTVSCVDCQAYLNSHCSKAPDSAQKWQCCFCKRINVVPQGAQGLVGLPRETVEYRPTPNADHTSKDLCTIGTTKILAVDLATPPRQLELLKRAAIDVLGALPDASKVALITYNSAVSVYRIGLLRSQGGAVDTDMLPCSSGNPKLMDKLLQGVHVMSVGACRPSLQAALESLRSQPARNTTIGLAAAVHVAVKLGEHKTPANGPSANGDSVSTLPDAQEMDRKDSNANAAQLLILTGSSQELVGGSEEARIAAEEELTQLFHTVAAFAAQRGTSINVMAAMEDPLTAANLNMLSQGTGGTLIWHRGAGPSLGANVRSLLTRQAGLHCHLEIQLSEGLCIQSAYGPMAPLSLAGVPTPLGQAHATDRVPRRWQNLQSWHYLCDIPEGGRGLTFLLGYNLSRVVSPAYIQVALHWLDQQGRPVHRVVTRQLTKMTNSQEGQEEREEGGQEGASTDGETALCPKATGIVWTKYLVAEAVHKGAALNRMQAEIMRKMVGKCLHEFAELYGVIINRGGWLLGSSKFGLPTPARTLAEALYFYQRKLLLQKYSTTAQAGQELWQVNYFAAPIGLADRMCVPHLHAIFPQTLAKGGSAQQLSIYSGPALEMQQIPPCDLALLLSSGAVVDYGSDVYIWVSPDVGDQQRVREACTALAYELACSRCPAADVSILHPGSNQEAEVVESLNPMSRDSFEEQKAQFPMIESLPQEQVASVLKRRREAQGGSLLQWMLQNNVVFI